METNNPNSELGWHLLKTVAASFNISRLDEKEAESGLTEAEQKQRREAKIQFWLNGLPVLFDIGEKIIADLVPQPQVEPRRPQFTIFTRKPMPIEQIPQILEWYKRNGH